MPNLTCPTCHTDLNVQEVPAEGVSCPACGTTIPVPVQTPSSPPLSPSPQASFTANDAGVPIPPDAAPAQVYGQTPPPPAQYAPNGATTGQPATGTAPTDQPYAQAVPQQQYAPNGQPYAQAVPQQQYGPGGQPYAQAAPQQQYAPNGQPYAQAPQQQYAPGGAPGTQPFYNTTTYQTQPVGASPKDKTVALLLCIFLGGLGVHRFYAGKIGTGIIWLLTGGCLAVGWIVDIVLIATDSFKDGDGLPITNG